MPEGGAIQYLAFGHITRDCLPDGAFIPGGTALYSAATAARLGMRAAIMTAASPDHLPAAPSPLVVSLDPAPATTTFANHYTSAGRRQWLYDLAPPIRLDRLPPAWRTAPIVHLAPVVGEVDLAWVTAFPTALIGVTPQGWMRAWDKPLPAPIRPAVWQPDPDLLRRVTLVVLSIEDVDGDEALAASYAAYCPLVAVTRGAGGATLYVHGAPHFIPALPAIERDPTGAGDVFAAAMLVHLWETGDPLAAARFASGAAACAVEGMGLTALPTRAAVADRLTTAPGGTARW